MTCTCIGGLGFSLKEIGISLTVAGVLMLPMTMCAFPLVRCCNILYYHFYNTHAISLHSWRREWAPSRLSMSQEYR